ncbi:MAG: glycosyltransferase [Bacteroidota bacterium]
MIVAINLTGFISESHHDTGVNFFRRLAVERSGDAFVFISDRQPGTYTNLPPNIQLLLSKPLGKNSLFQKHWYNKTLPALGKKTGANVLIHAAGISTASCDIPQIVFANDYYTPALFTTADEKLQAYFRKNRPVILERASNVIVRSELEKTTLAELYPTATGKIKVIQSSITEGYAPTDYFNKEATKEKYTEGKEYFLFNGPMDGNEAALINLLKAFSFLKKRQKTNMQLLFIPGSDSGVAGFAEKLRSYKFRDDVKLIDGLYELEVANLIAAAYAFVYPLQSVSDLTFILRALQSGVPVIATNNALIKEVAGDGALYVDATDFMDIANNLALVFKDEAAREKLEQHCLLIEAKLKASSPLDEFWQLIAATN